MSFAYYSSSLLRYPDLGFSLDPSLMGIAPAYTESMREKIDRAFADMTALESGAIANRDENRQVGHYWLRQPELAPTPELHEKIVAPLADLKKFAKKILSGKIKAPCGKRFRRVLLVGIGGSALGPQLVADALGGNSKIAIDFLDNTDPAGIDRVLHRIGKRGLARTLVLVISKSGGTPETRNGMIEVQAAYHKADLDFGPHCVAITGVGSQLDEFAIRENFIARFPMEEWGGGRTSVMSTVGLVPAALQGIDIDAFLAGAAAMDAKTRVPDVSRNASMQLALAWHHAGNGRGEKDMVVLPYKDSLALFAKYLQQLVMESLGKELDLDKNVVHQGIAVYGNKGSTDQHAYVQQLRDGVPNFFAVFIEVRKDRDRKSPEVAPGITSGDYLQGFLRGTRKALHDAGRPSLTISVPEVGPFQLGMLIALFERAVSFYASLVNINAYHQPGVQAGKKAADDFLDLLGKVRAKLGDSPVGAEALATDLGADAEAVHHCLVHLAANGQATAREGNTPADDRFGAA